jgi:hypothetical protein
VGGEGQVVAARRARGTREDDIRVLFGPKCSPNLGPIWGEMGCPGRAETGLGAALGAVFGPVMSVWTKTDR